MSTAIQNRKFETVSQKGSDHRNDCAGSYGKFPMKEDVLGLIVGKQIGS
jgi:hypothetical protein